MGRQNFIDAFNRDMDALEKVSEKIKAFVDKLKNSGIAPLSDQQIVAANETSLLELLEMAYADNQITDEERTIINNRISALGISVDRAKELEEQVRNKKGGSNIISTTNIVPSKPASIADLAWPSTGYTFLKAVRSILDISRFPFTPTEIADDECIEEEDYVYWQINDNYFLSVDFTGKYKDKIFISWGIYSEYEKRDPAFRKTVKEMEEYPDLLDRNGDVSIDGVSYFLNDYLGFEASEKRNISQINNPDFIRHVVDNLLAFANKAWPVINKNLLASSTSIDQSVTAVDGDVDWPTAGHAFIKSVKKSLDISLLPFKPTYVSDDAELEDEKSKPEIDWDISDKHYFAVWLTGKRKDKVDVHWGLYSSNEKRDPLIRKTCDDLSKIPELLDQDDDVSIDGVKYLWNDEGLLGQEANERKLISEINNPDFIKHVVDNLVAFANKAWPVIQKNLVNG